MRKVALAVHPDQPDPVLLHRLFFIQQVCLAVVAQLAAITLIVWFVRPLMQFLPSVSTGMNLRFALASLAAVLGFYLSEYGVSRRLRYLSWIFSSLTALIASTVLLHNVHLVLLNEGSILTANHETSLDGAMAFRPATAFVLLAVVMVLIQYKKPILRRIADVATAGLCFLVLILVSEYIFGSLRLFGLTNTDPSSPHALACIVPLTAVAALRQSEHGMFSIFLGRGIGSRIARILGPILVVLPFLREAERARLINARLIPANYATAILTSTATVLAFALLVFLAWYINGMESKIQDLTLRDELTGLYNLRGFYLMGEQALRMAYRSQSPFTVLFVDLDNLKQINDKLGHQVGSAALVETARLLDATFREVDVIGRIGGDEFVVAGQFNSLVTEAAIERLRTAAEARSSDSGGGLPLSYSIGCAISNSSLHESLQDLVARADEAMYEQKRHKKARAS
jgi:diguanylate cyclase (GGDEF)-like protein